MAKTKTPSLSPQKPKMGSGDHQDEVTIGSTTIKLRDKKTDVPEVTTTLYKKEKRETLSEKDRVDLFKSATYKHSTTYFDLISMSLDSADKLDDCYNVEMKINKTSQRHRMYDMHDVFTVMLVDEDGRDILECNDLYTEYPALTIEQVAESNKWYNTWPSEDTYRENLNLTYRFFENNTSPALFEKVSETYDEFEENEKGGPLFFIIMINAIMSQTEEASLSLQTRLKSLDLKDFPGENVDKVVGLLRAVLRRLKMFHRVPEDTTCTLLRIFQTSSVPQFNDVFAMMEQQRLLGQVSLGTTLGTSSTALITNENIFKVAVSFFQLLREEDKWTGEATLGTDRSVFVARTCWNCGGAGHDIKTCSKPKNAKLIELNKKKFHADKKKGHRSTGPTNRSTPPSRPASAPGTGKWRKPEPAENNRRTIDGKSWFWKQSVKRWVPDRDAAHVAQPAAAPTATPAPSPAPTPVAAAATAPGPMAAVAMPDPSRAVALHRFQSAYSSLLDHMNRS